MLRTPLTDLLGCSVPVVGAPMGGAAGSALAAAVTAGGGVGLVGVERAWSTETLAARLADAGPGTGAGLLAWALEGDPAAFDAVVAARPALVSVAYGEWPPWIRRLRAAGIPSATAVGSVEGAREAAAEGVDVLVVRGGEGGGHGWDELATLPLLAEVLDTVEHPCVVAAGGIGSGRGLAAVLAAGAAGAWVGTALLATEQSGSPESSRAAVVAAAATDTAYSHVHDVAGGVWPAEFGGRSLRDRFVERWRGREGEMDDAAVGEITASYAQGEPAVWAGQGVGLVRGHRSATDVVAGLAADAERLLGRWG